MKHWDFVSDIKIWIEKKNEKEYLHFKSKNYLENKTIANNCKSNLVLEFDWFTFKINLSFSLCKMSKKLFLFYRNLSNVFLFIVDENIVSDKFRAKKKE